MNNIFTDFFTLYKIGTDLWNGQYTGIYPLPANGFFAMFALLPKWAALATLLFISLALFVSVFKRKALLWILFVPVLQVLWLGQVDLIPLWLLAHFSPASLALLTLKPQLFILAIPQLLQRKELWKPFAILTAILYLPITIIRPTWIIEWIGQSLSEGRLGQPFISLFIPISAIAAFSILVITKKLTFERMFWCFNPTLRWYDYSLLAGKSYWLIPLSWAILSISQINPPNFYWTYALLGLVAQIRMEVPHFQIPKAFAHFLRPSHPQSQEPQAFHSR